MTEVGLVRMKAGFDWFYGISAILGYLMPNAF